MEGDQTVLGVIIAVVGVAGSVLVAAISRPHPDPPGPRPSGEPVQARDLTTIAGIAEVVASQSHKIQSLEARQLEHEEHARLQDRTIQALRRWAAVLETALRSTGASVPEPNPEDAPLIRGS
ncbi:hypothetical protein [Peterkaempfera griseoplana]|uniref:hypothetical protein n=1 Tax=Peterkaempfera griseoplana TaxID=66896 RepID=UPI0006E4041F|nr:hypothetical protein [Peterkaempfera griseoplana]